MGQLLGAGEPLLQLAADLRPRAGARLRRRPRGGAPRRDEPRATLLGSGGETGDGQRRAAGVVEAPPHPAALLWLKEACDGAEPGILSQVYRTGGDRQRRTGAAFHLGAGRDDTVALSQRRDRLVL